MKSRYCFMKCVYWIMTQNIFHSEVCSPKLENTYPRERTGWCYYSQTIWAPAAYEMAASGDGKQLWSSDTGNDKQHAERETLLQGVQCSKFLRHASTDDTPQAPAEIHVWPRHWTPSPMPPASDLQSRRNWPYSIHSRYLGGWHLLQFLARLTSFVIVLTNKWTIFSWGFKPAWNTGFSHFLSAALGRRWLCPQRSRQRRTSADPPAHPSLRKSQAARLSPCHASWTSRGGQAGGPHVTGVSGGNYTMKMCHRNHTVKWVLLSPPIS